MTHHDAMGRAGRAEQRPSSGGGSRKALEGVRILDMSRVLAGPFATQILSDLGADVIKIEHPVRGDDTRTWGPPFQEGESAYFFSVNRGKRSVTVDLKTEAGVQLIRELAAKSDALIENMKPGDMIRYGLGYEELAQIHPGLVYCSITGFGETGPMRRLPGYDFAVQAMCGIMAMTGEPDGEPMKVGVAWVDILTGLYAVIGILAALRAREATGRGQHIDLSLWDVGVAAMANLAGAYLMSKEEPPRHGNAHAQIVPYQLFPTEDGYIVIAVGNDGQFARFARVIGLPELAEDERFRTNPARVRHRDELVPRLEVALRTRPTDAWLPPLGDAGVPAAPLWGLDAAFTSELARARGVRWSMEHPTAGPMETVANPLQHMSDTPATPQGPPPLLGEHTEQVLRELLQYDDAALQRLRDAGAVDSEGRQTG